MLLPALADNGHLDLAYELLLQPRSPGWMYMIDRGATTVWERWDGVDDDGVPHDSLNHYSKGAVDLLPAPLHGRSRPDVARATARSRSGRGLAAD